jgi:hypothetical protein
VLWLEWNSKSIEQKLGIWLVKLKGFLRNAWLISRKVEFLPKFENIVPGTTSVEMGQLFPGFLTQILREGFFRIWKINERLFDKWSYITRSESRTSSPVRIQRFCNIWAPANKNCILAEEQAMLEELYLPLMEMCYDDWGKFKYKINQLNLLSFNIDSWLVLYGS